MTPAWNDYLIDRLTHPERAPGGVQGLVALAREAGTHLKALEAAAKAVCDSGVLIANGQEESVSRAAMDALRAALIAQSGPVPGPVP